MSDRIPMTRTGYDKLKADLDQLHTVELPKILERLGNARAEGDLTENAEYTGAQESRALMEARINVLRDKLSRAVLIDPSQFPKDEVAFGATVRVKDLNFGDEEEFTLVGAGEEDYDTRQDSHHQSAGPGPGRQEDRRPGRNRRAARDAEVRDSRNPGRGVGLGSSGLASRRCIS